MLNLMATSLVFCAGGGSVGTEAARAARSYGTVLVVDSDPRCQASSIADNVARDLASLELGEVGKIQLLIGRAEEALLDLMSVRVPELVVPAINGHYAAKVAQTYLGRREMGILPLPLLLKEAAQSLPGEIILTVDEQNGVLITSHMPLGQTCRTPCVQEPICPVTGKHKEPMNQMISKALKGSIHRVMVSHLLGKVGAINGSDFSGLIADLRVLKQGDTMALATACECHAIANFFAIVSQ